MTMDNNKQICERITKNMLWWNETFSKIFKDNISFKALDHYAVGEDLIAPTEGGKAIYLYSGKKPLGVLHFEVKDKEILIEAIEPMFNPHQRDFVVPKVANKRWFEFITNYFIVSSMSTITDLKYSLKFRALKTAHYRLHNAQDAWDRLGFREYARYDDKYLDQLRAYEERQMNSNTKEKFVPKGLPKEYLDEKRIHDAVQNRIKSAKSALEFYSRIRDLFFTNVRMTKNGLEDSVLNFEKQRVKDLFGWNKKLGFCIMSKMDESIKPRSKPESVKKPKTYRPK